MNLNDLVLRTAVLKILNDRISAAFRQAKLDVSSILGAEGRMNAVLNGVKLGSVSVSKSGRFSVTDEEALIAWVTEHYPTEVEEVVRVRPAFMRMIRASTEAAGQPCAPKGELDVPGIDLGESYPMVRKTPEADAYISEMWARGQIDLSALELEATDDRHEDHQGHPEGS